MHVRTSITRPEAPQRGGLRRYLFLAFGLSWLFWVPMALGQRGLVDLPVPALVLAILGGLGPIAAALLLTARGAGAQGVRALFSQLRLRGLERRWLWIALATGLVDLSPAVLHVASGGPLPEGILGQVLAMPFHFVFVAFLGGGLDEEMGWRGYALPRLQQRMAPLPANLLLGLAWALWHVPLFFDPTGSHAATSFPVYVATVVAQSLVIGWLYNASGGSLLVAVIAHSVHDVADGLRFAIVTDGGPTAATVQLLAAVAVALAVVVATRGRLGAPAPDALPASPAAPRRLTA